ncbi:intraflagellar transport protein 22 homolog isoform X2 [Neoarius graeffei]|uniref:intraflagellar transport protein 22 homolog isoform X2 n=1 Tax=Neoarius graeffei TaxID=443677 RepID=UPI00298C0597|nr:intraflagellar transport protein 22 homolog isoform X2 [Neoarius graeffei]
MLKVKNLKVKILLIGPRESGKTVLANFLSDTVETIGGDYSPTQGVRFEACWSAILKDSSGVVVVFNPDVPSHLTEAETWYSTFISSQRLQAGQCLLIAHHKPGSGADTSRPHLAPQLNKLPLIHSNLDEDPEGVRQEFRTYLGNVVQSLSESREREEMSIIA